MWVDLRLNRSDVGAAITAIASEFRAVYLCVDSAPPSAAPNREWELSVNGITVDAITDLLTGVNIHVLATRTRDHVKDK